MYLITVILSFPFLYFSIRTYCIIPKLYENYSNVVELVCFVLYSNEYTYIATTCTSLHTCSDDSDDNEHETTPLIKPTSDPDISSDDLMMTTITGNNKNSIKWLQSKATNFFKAFCIPGVIVVRYVVWMCFNLLVALCSINMDVLYAQYIYVYRHLIIIVQLFSIAKYNSILISLVCLLLCLPETCELFLLLLATILS